MAGLTATPRPRAGRGRRGGGAYLIAGTLQPASYSPVRKTISAMAGQAGTVIVLFGATGDLARRKLLRVEHRGACRGVRGRGHGDVRA
jgi:hypothetical protein